MTPGKNAIKIHPYFNLREFDCRGDGEKECSCGGAAILNSLFFNRLVIFRRYLDAPMHIQRGYSCPSWNKKVGGKEHSKHITGMAIDWNVYSSGYTEAEAAKIALDAGIFTGIGIYGKSYRDPGTQDIVFVRGYGNMRGMVHLEYCKKEDSGDKLGKTKLYRRWGDWSDG